MGAKAILGSLLREAGRLEGESTQRADGLDKLIGQGVEQWINSEMGSCCLQSCLGCQRSCNLAKQEQQGSDSYTSFMKLLKREGED